MARHEEGTLEELNELDRLDEEAAEHQRWLDDNEPHPEPDEDGYVKMMENWGAKQAHEEEAMARARAGFPAGQC